MARLTKKDVIDTISNGQSMFVLGRTIGKALTSRLLSEMLEYKDIEDELGIDLITLFNALKNGVYTKEKYFIPALIFYDITEEKCLWLDDKEYYFRDYGKTWALTKEELK